MGGIGKSTLAAEITARIGHLEPERVTATLSGVVSADSFLAELADALRRPVAGAAGPALAVAAAARIDLPWADRLALLREHVLGKVPVLVVLDDFDDNLAAGTGGRTVRDPVLAALLASWVAAPHRGRLLITARDTFALPGAAERALGFRHLGPLSHFDALELGRSLSALGLLSDSELDRAWRLLGGHPRAMEYLDTLLSSGRLSFADAADRLAGVVQERHGSHAEPHAPAGLPSAIAEAIALAAAGLLLGDLFGGLSADAQRLLIGASVYRAPADRNAMLFQVGRHDPAAVRIPDPPYRAPAGLAGLMAACEAAGLLSADRRCWPPTVSVSRWTASELHRRLARTRRGGEVADAHRRAAEYLQWRASTQRQDRHADVHDQLEARYHLLQAGDPGQASDLAELVRRQLHAWGALDAEAALVHDAQARVQAQPATRGNEAGTLPAGGTRRRRLRVSALVLVAVAAYTAAEMAGVFSAPHLARATAPAVASAPPIRSGPASQAAAARESQAAAWVAAQLSADAIVACDPAMCSALQAHGIAAGKLLVLRPGETGPLGSDVVLATAAVRRQFGGRLASEYAPAVIASFGSGALRIDVRAVALAGAAAYRAALAADLAARRTAGTELLQNPQIGVSADARSELSAGLVDTRLLMTIASLAAAGSVRIVAFSDSGPGASAGMPLRAAEVAVPTPAADAGALDAGAALRSMLAFVRAQQPPYRPARADLRTIAGQSVLSIEFAAPSPVGLLQTQPAP
jgi:hypothetical protein